ncbi:hypothetical protein CIL03_02095 [Virgibacillus indicus]|uniref:LysM domain-containing protein n=1 Tax=Virgibacillus indicus TaxID=2024554 RepID=A0A265NDU4_9BACI|nr:hypothetical protein [Virgibacillus indicus]OZU89955.1 hypothetical protein CIL03_02095 [Virgibacillus indicus]
MYFIKRISLYIFLILLFLSIYKDIMSGYNIPDNNSPKIQQTVKIDFEIVHIKVKSGETVLSIVEKINNNDIEILNVNQIISDFRLANPETDPFQLQTGHYYYFPLY